MTRLITREDVVLRLQGLGLCDLKPDQCVALDQIDSYFKPEKIGKPVPIRGHIGVQNQVVSLGFLALCSCLLPLDIIGYFFAV